MMDVLPQMNEPYTNVPGGVGVNIALCHILCDKTEQKPVLRVG